MEARSALARKSLPLPATAGAEASEHAIAPAADCLGPAGGSQAEDSLGAPTALKPSLFSAMLGLPYGVQPRASKALSSVSG